MSSREAFEAWVDSNFPFKKDRFDLFRGEYKSQFTEQLWQSWQASREGLDARLKSAENNDVDARCRVAELEAKCAALAAENAGLKISILNTQGAIELACAAVNDDRRGDVFRDILNAIYVKTASEAPATDSFLAEVRAQGVDALNIQFKKCSGMLYADSVIETAAEFAAQLRQGAAL